MVKGEKQGVWKSSEKGRKWEREDESSVRKTEGTKTKGGKKREERKGA